MSSPVATLGVQHRQLPSGLGDISSIVTHGTHCARRREMAASPIDMLLLHAEQEFGMAPHIEALACLALGIGEHL